VEILTTTKNIENNLAIRVGKIIETGLGRKKETIPLNQKEYKIMIHQ
jgi:hypothetical protein